MRQRRRSGHLSAVRCRLDHSVDIGDTVFNYVPAISPVALFLNYFRQSHGLMVVLEKSSILQACSAPTVSNHVFVELALGAEASSLLDLDHFECLREGMKGYCKVTTF